MEGFFDAFFKGARGHALLKILGSIPRNQWIDLDHGVGGTLLHRACSVGDLILALGLIRRGASIEARTSYGATPLYEAIKKDNIVEALIAMGADIRSKARWNDSPFDRAVRGRFDIRSARIMIANGARLRGEQRNEADLMAFQRGVVRCRSAVIAIRTVKCKRCNWARVDKFLMAMISCEVWATRCEWA